MAKDVGMKGLDSGAPNCMELLLSEYEVLSGKTIIHGDTLKIADTFYSKTVLFAIYHIFSTLRHCHPIYTKVQP
jgi:hypothetical protein